MPRLALFVALLLVAGCDSEDQPLTPAEQVAGTWDLVRVKDGNRTVTDRFEEVVGSAVFRFESVGCCSESADYRLTITRPDGERIEIDARYRVNDNPETPNYFVLFTGRPQESLFITYDWDRRYSRFSLEATRVEARLLETLGALELGYPFQESMSLQLQRR
jgi:hypothetical protein